MITFNLIIPNVFPQAINPLRAQAFSVMSVSGIEPAIDKFTIKVPDNLNAAMDCYSTWDSSYNLFWLSIELVD